MIKKFKNKKAQSTIEIVTIFILVMAALLVFQKYFAQAIYGRWKGVGESWSFGREYDEKDTTECIYNVWGKNNRWYEATCFEETCRTQCVGSLATPADCNTCLNNNCVSNLDGVDVCCIDNGVNICG